jgi:hypothetical protein
MHYPAMIISLVAGRILLAFIYYWKKFDADKLGENQAVIYFLLTNGISMNFTKV